jgi:hypothetical protein
MKGAQRRNGASSLPSENHTSSKKKNIKNISLDNLDRGEKDMEKIE